MWACGVCDCRTKMRMSAHLWVNKAFSFFATNKRKECDASLDFFFFIFSSKREESSSNATTINFIMDYIFFFILLVSTHHSLFLVVCLFAYFACSLILWNCLNGWWISYFDSCLVAVVIWWVCMSEWVCARLLSIQEFQMKCRRVAQRVLDNILIK